MVTIHYTTRFNITKNSAFWSHSAFTCFVWISEQTAIISPDNIKWLVFVTRMECVYCAVRAEPLIWYKLTRGFWIQTQHLRSKANSLYPNFTLYPTLTLQPSPQLTSCPVTYRLVLAVLNLRVLLADSWLVRCKCSVWGWIELAQDRDSCRLWY